ncbi:hypothetical protein NQ318_002602 [Aromia moschata]|uniref:Jumonji domain-containing protein 4 n=1 Tax=Aromia moschata TaxID=1265417 RepID=A0AAV8XXD1_9CUCU|nr:hypothetical protein NQ318_002602 [Aromia moschata]
MNFETASANYLIYNINYSLMTDIPVIDPSKFSYNNFFEKYMLLNWEASRFWINEGKPDFEYLSEKYGKNEVTIYNCSEKYYNSQKTQEYSLDEYLNWWKQHRSGSGSISLQYLKDWHLKLHNENDNFYEVPIYFASDWLNEYYSECLNDDYRFVYMGPKDTTPFHADVFTSYSWSVNVCGRKRWLMFPPGEEDYLKDNLGNLPYDVTKLNHTRQFFEVVQNPGEAIFVPSGWHHQVWNLDDAISVNHNWVNACNIRTMWTSMLNNLKLVRKEIEDCVGMEGFDEHCQTMLNASFGMDFYKFYDFIKFIATSRMDMLKGNKSKVLFHRHTIGPNHILVDLKSVKSTVELFVNCEDVTSLSYFVNSVDVYKILEDINLILENIVE